MRYTIYVRFTYLLLTYLLASIWYAVANLAENKESFVSNRRQYKRHVRNQWTHGQASRAVDGDVQSSLHSCTLLDNFYVDKPVWMVDLGARTVVSGVVIVTWQSADQQNNSKSHYSPYY